MNQSAPTTVEPTADQITAERANAELEHQHHGYISNVIPWYVRLIWVLFWMFVVYYGITYFLPAIQRELVPPS